MANERPVKVADAMRPAAASVNEDATPREVFATMDSEDVDELPVVASDGLFRAMLARRTVERRVYDGHQEEARAGTIAEDVVARVRPESSIDGAIDRMLADDLAVMPVVASDDRLAGVLVLDDLRRVPDLVEAGLERRRLREVADEAGVSKVMIGCSLLSAFLGLFLFAMWIEGPVYGLPRWVAWVDGLAALLAFIGALTASSREMFAVPLWTIAGVGLCFAAGIAHVWRDGAWATWLQLALALTFFLMAVVIGSTMPRRDRIRTVLRPTGATSP
jgi:CBS domain-containing protein